MVPAGRPPISESCGAKATKRDTTMLSKTKIALAAALVIGTASTALAAGYVAPSSLYDAPSGDHNAFAPCFDAAGRWYWPTTNNDCGVDYYPTARNTYGFVPPVTHHHHRSPR
jgi:hypothetical protein